MHLWYKKTTQQYKLKQLNMKRVVFFVIIPVLIAKLSFGSNSMSMYPIMDAIKKNLIKVNVLARGYAIENHSSYYGKCINLKIKNLTSSKLIINVDCGRKLDCIYDSIQDMIITKSEILSLLPNQQTDFTINAMCGQLSHKTPSESSAYKFGNLVDNVLLKVVKLIEELDCQNDAGQFAVWVFTDNMSPESINTYFGNKEKAKKLKEYVFTLKGINKKETGYIYDYSYPKTDSAFTNIIGEIQWIMPSDGKVSFILYDNYGDQIVTIFNNIQYSKGLQTYRYKLTDLSLKKGELYWLRLKSDGNKIKELAIQTDL